MAALGAKRALARRVKFRRCVRRRIAADRRGRELKRYFAVLIAAITIAACTTAPPPPPVIASQAEDRYLVDPRLGYPASPLDQRFDRIWQFIRAGQEAT